MADQHGHGHTCVWEMCTCMGTHVFDRYTWAWVHVFMADMNKNERHMDMKIWLQPWLYGIGFINSYAQVQRGNNAYAWVHMCMADMHGQWVHVFMAGHEHE